MSSTIVAPLVSGCGQLAGLHSRQRETNRRAVASQPRPGQELPIITGKSLRKHHPKAGQRFGLQSPSGKNLPQQPRLRCQAAESSALQSGESGDLTGPEAPSRPSEPVIIDDPKPLDKSSNPPLLTIIAAVVIIIGFVTALRPVFRFLAEGLSEYAPRAGEVVTKLPSFAIGLVLFVGGWAIELLYTIYVRLFIAPITTAISLVVGITLLVFLLRRTRQQPGGKVPPEESSLAIEQ